MNNEIGTYHLYSYMRRVYADIPLCNSKSPKEFGLTKKKKKYKKS